MAMIFGGKGRIPYKLGQLNGDAVCLLYQGLWLKVRCADEQKDELFRPGWSAMLSKLL